MSTETTRGVSSLDELNRLFERVFEDVSHIRFFSAHDREFKDCCSLVWHSLDSFDARPSSSLVPALETQALFHLDTHHSKMGSEATPPGAKVAANRSSPDGASSARLYFRAFDGIGNLVNTSFYKFVDKVDVLEEASGNLARQSIIAVDLENHDYYSYQGYSCLLQISTLECDYIIDAIKLKDVIGGKLGPIFANPQILKLFHDSVSDCLWLQRDFGIRVEGMFDTYIASWTLKLPGHSLAYLVKRYCNVDIDKSQQRADWRIRPLPGKMLQYARDDTRYLIRVFKCLMQDILASENADCLADEISTRSTAISSKRYAHVFSPEKAYQSVVSLSRSRLTTQQARLIREIVIWRNKVAREKDTSPVSVLSKQLILKLATDARPKTRQSALKLALSAVQMEELFQILEKDNKAQ